MKLFPQRNLLFALPMFLVFPSFAQFGTHSLTFAVGVAFPVRHYGAHIAGDKPSAATGLAGEMSYRYQIPHSAFGLILTVRVRLNTVTSHFIPHEDSAMLYGDEPGTMREAAILAGLGYRTTLGRHWYLEENLLMGAAKVLLSPTHSVAVKDPSTSNPTVSQATASGGETTGFSAVFQLGPVFRLNEKAELFLKADYWYTRARMPQSVFFYGTVESYGQAQMNKNPSTVNVVIGFRRNL